MNLNEQIEAATTKVITENLPLMVEEKVKKMIDGLLTDMFCDYGEIAKLVKESIIEQLDVNLQKFSLVDYNSFISQAITSALNEQMAKEVLKPVEDLIKNIINPLEKESFTLEEIHTRYIEFLMEENQHKGEGEFTFTIDDSNSYIILSIDPEPHKNKHSCEIELCISESDGKVFLFRTATSWGKRTEVDPVKLTQLDEFQLFLFRLYSTNTPITEVANMKYLDNSWSRYD